MHILRGLSKGMIKVESIFFKYQLLDPYLSSSLLITGLFFSAFIFSLTTSFDH